MSSPSINTLSFLNPYIIILSYFFFYLCIRYTIRKKKIEQGFYKRERERERERERKREGERG